MPNAIYRPREYLTETEVEGLIETARKPGSQRPKRCCRDPASESTRIDAADLCQLRWAQIDLCQGRLHVNRATGGIESV
jgi:integrase